MVFYAKIEKYTPPNYFFRNFSKFWEPFFKHFPAIGSVEQKTLK